MFKYLRQVIKLRLLNPNDMRYIPPPQIEKIPEKKRLPKIEPIVIATRKEETAKTQTDGIAAIATYKAGYFTGFEGIHVVFRAPGKAR
jgi:hypothetical protein